MAATPDVVDLGRPRPLKDAPECVDQIETMNIVAHLLAFVAEHAIGPACHRAFHHVDYRAEGIHLDEKDIEDLGRVMSAWWEGLHTVLACAKAKPVQSRMPDLERERHERRRAWLASASSHQW